MLINPASHSPTSKSTVNHQQKITYFLSKPVTPALLPTAQQFLKLLSNTSMTRCPSMKQPMSHSWSLSRRKDCIQREMNHTCWASSMIAAILRLIWTWIIAYSVKFELIFRIILQIVMSWNLCLRNDFCVKFLLSEIYSVKNSIEIITIITFDPWISDKICDKPLNLTNRPFILLSHDDSILLNDKVCLKCHLRKEYGAHVNDLLFHPFMDKSFNIYYLVATCTE